MKRDPSVPIVEFVEHPGVFFADKCIGYDCWKAALSRALVIPSRFGRICTSGKIGQ